MKAAGASTTKAPRAPRGLDALREAIYADVQGACETLYRIDARDGSGLAFAHLWPHQRRMFRALQGQRQRGEPPRGLYLKTRRAGTSTASALWTFHHTYWRPRQRALTVAHHDTTTAFLYQIYRTIYEELPEELQLPLQKLNRKELACEAPWGSSIIAQTAGYLDIGRGMTIQHAHLSEIDFWPDPEVALDGILNTVSYSPSTTIIIESTANGADGWLHHFWKESVRGKTGFIAQFQAWHQVPEHRAKVGEDFAASKQELEWMREFHLDAAQICWYRYKLAETIAKEPWGGERKMRQEYPFTAEEAFQSSGMCVFPDLVLNTQAQYVAEPAEIFQLTAIGAGDYTMVPTDNIDKADFFVWERPKADCFYSHGIDIGGGVGRTESVVSIWKYPGYIQVATWASKNTSVDGTAFVARWLAELYGGPKALVVPEINKDGPMILYILQGLPGSFELFRWRYLDKVVALSGDNPKLGWETSSVTKNILAQVANMVFLRGVQGSGEGVVRDEKLLEQMRRCIDLLPHRRWQAVGGLSDRIIAALIAIIGAYLEFEGGSVSPVGPLNQVGEADRKKKWREPGSYDAADEIFESVMHGRAPDRPAEDFE